MPWALRQEPTPVRAFPLRREPHCHAVSGPKTRRPTYAPVVVRAPSRVAPGPLRARIIAAAKGENKDTLLRPAVNIAVPELRTAFA